jgi:hypothetical protein
LQIKSALEQGKLIQICDDKVLVKTMYWHNGLLVTGLNKNISVEMIKAGRCLLGSDKFKST